MRVHVLGSAAGGGFPQWNCGCFNCQGIRSGTISARPRTQTSIAISTDDRNWFLIHASPDIRTQLLSFPPLGPRSLRDSPIAGIILTNADLDQCLGLLSLREAQPLHIYATESVRRSFVDRNRLYRALCRTPDQITWHELKLETRQALGHEYSTGTLAVTPLSVPGKRPLYLEEHSEWEPSDNIALLVEDEKRGRVLAYAPCVGGKNVSVNRLLNQTDCVFFDGTFWSDDELPRLGIGSRTARDMAHWPLSGVHGSLRVLAKATAQRRFLIHINNTNPVLREDSAERQEVEEAEIEVAYDGLEVEV